MQKEKKKTPDNTDEDKLTKVEEVSEEVSEFIEGAHDTKNIIEYLLETLESRGRRLEVVLDDDDFALSEGRIASALLALLAEQGEKLKDEATDYKKNVDKFVNP